MQALRLHTVAFRRRMLDGNIVVAWLRNPMQTREHRSAFAAPTPFTSEK